MLPLIETSSVIGVPSNCTTRASVLAICTASRYTSLDFNAAVIT